MPIKSVGPLASRPTVPALGDEYSATDTQQRFTCFTAGTWTADALAALSRTLLPIRNESGSTIIKGRLLYATGFSLGRVTVDLADKDNSTKRPAICVSQGDISNNTDTEGLVTGELVDIDTSAFNLTDQLVLGNSGNFSRPPPDVIGFTGEVQLVGSVTRIHATNGRIVVDCGQGLLPTTADQIYALAGTSGSPSDTNRYVTNSDPRIASPLRQSLFTELTVDTSTTSTAFVTLMSQAITTVAGTKLLIFLSAGTSNGSLSAITSFRIQVDGVTKRAVGTNSSTGNDPSSVSLVLQVPGLAAGVHTVTVQWKTTTSTVRIFPVTDPDDEHASLLVQEIG